MRERAIGAFLLAVGALLGYLCVYQPLEAAERQADSVSFSLKGAVLCPIAVVMGAIYLLMGQHATTIFGTRDEPKPAVWVIGIALAAAGFGLYFWLKAALAAKGYAA